ncbi:MAG: L,D-transpeptidase family protein [Bacteroidota bacterium]
MNQKTAFTLPLLLSFFACQPAESQPAKPSLFQNCGQLVIVVSPSESSTSAKLYRFEKHGSTWRQVGEAHPVSLGLKGIAWGRGLHEPQPGNQKKEGDLKSPAGIFRFGTAFGYAASPGFPLKLAYVQATSTLQCVEDVKSKFYNQLADKNYPGKDWEQKDVMLREDVQFKWGIFIEQNLPPVPGSGSCIFFHVWRSTGSATRGCTGMSEGDLVGLMRWLDSGKEPLLVQVREGDYEVFRKKYCLPGLD